MVKQAIGLPDTGITSVPDTSDTLSRYDVGLAQFASQSIALNAVDPYLLAAAMEEKPIAPSTKTAELGDAVTASTSASQSAAAPDAWPEMCADTRSLLVLDRVGV